VFIIIITSLTFSPASLLSIIEFSFSFFCVNGHGEVMVFSVCEIVNDNFVLDASFHSIFELVVTIANVIESAFLISDSFSIVGDENVVIMFLSDILTVCWVSSSCHPVDGQKCFLINSTSHPLGTLLPILLVVPSCHFPVLVHANIVGRKSIFECIDWQEEHSIIGFTVTNLMPQCFSPS